MPLITHNTCGKRSDTHVYKISPPHHALRNNTPLSYQQINKNITGHAHAAALNRIPCVTENSARKVDYFDMKQKWIKWVVAGGRRVNVLVNLTTIQYIAILATQGSCNLIAAPVRKLAHKRLAI